MKVGIEEEFIVVDPKTLGCSPGAFRLATGLIYTNSTYIRKCSVELPLNSGSVSKILSHLSEAFCVFEIKTDPYENIDDLKEELAFHRKTLVDCAKENHLLILPSGLHPAHRSSDLIDNCAALHVHLDYSKERFDRLFAYIPFLLSLSANSPFLNGQVHAMSTRMMLSPHVNLPKGGLERHADIIHNPVLGTVEVKVFDSQITLDESLGLASMVKAIGENNRFDTSISKEEYQKRRQQAILTGEDHKEDFIDAEALDLLSDCNEYAKRKLSMSNGARWQIDVFNRYGLASVVSSLATSFEQDERVMKPSDTKLQNTPGSARNLWYIIPYLPFFIIDKYKKYHQDIRTSGGLALFRKN
jgi:hypothetical protein